MLRALSFQRLRPGASVLNSMLSPPKLRAEKRIIVTPGPTWRLETFSSQPRSLKSGLLSSNFQQVPLNLPSL